MLEKPRKIKQNWASVSWSTVWRLHVVHPSSPSADYISDAFLRLCFGRAVFVISGKIYFDVKMNFLTEAWLLHGVAYNRSRQSQGWWRLPQAHKSEPPRSCNSEGVLLCLLSFAAAVKPLANVIGNHICSDSHKKIDEDVAHMTHLLPVASMEAVTLPVYHTVLWIYIYVEINWGLIWNLIY